MNLAGLITFWALVIAAYAVLPQYWKFRLKAFIGFKATIISTCLALLLSLWLVSWSMFSEESSWKIWTQISAFLVLLIYIAFILITLLRGRATKNNIHRFRELISSLSINHQYEILISAISDNINHLSSIYDHVPYSRKLPWFWKHKLANKETQFRYQESLPHREEIIKLADQIITDREFTKFAIAYDIITPFTFIDVFENKITGLTDYLDAILELLITDTGSQLYREIQRHQNIGQGGRRDIGESQLLKYLFEDAELAKKRAIWKPIGEYVMRFLHNRPGGLDDIYNKEADYYTTPFTPDRFSDPVFVSLEFFDFMIREALIQNIKWHMWLYYLYHWVKEIVTKISYDPSQWEQGNREYPTRYAFLLYRVISYQLDWFDYAKENNINIHLEEGDIDINGNILQSSARCLSYCLYEISECKQLPDSFKRSLFTLWWNHYFDLESYQIGNYSQYAKYMLESLFTELEGRYGKTISYHMLGCLISGLTHVDEIKEWVNINTYKDRLSDIKEFINKYVSPSLEMVPTENRSKKLIIMLGTDFQLDNDTISVTNRFNSLTDLVTLNSM